MKADFDDPPDIGSGPPSVDGWRRLILLIVAVLIVVAVAVLVPRS